MMDYEKLRLKPTKFVTLTSLNADEFDYLLPTFTKELLRLYRKTSRGTVRLNKFQWRTELPSAAHHLFFILTYLKENPTQEFHGAIFDLSQETVSGVIKDCISALNETLRLKKLLPCKHGEEYADFIIDLKKRFSDNRNLYVGDSLMDCSEIEVQRPLDKGEQEDNYSGKKHYHTVKKLIISLFCGYITFASHHFTGAVGDKKVADLEEIKFLKDTYLWTDLGFIGYENQDVNLVIPHKKPRNKELTQAQKDENQMIASYRIRNEHAIGGMKRCRIMKDVIRIHNSEKRDIIFSACAGIHNLRTIFRNI
jgi:DDE superfamily endonuclease/Helix-turn-helix of DDE superfamily endonuclease